MQQLGSEKTHFHISRHEYSDYSMGDVEEQRQHPEQFRVIAPFETILDSVGPGQHAVSHLPCYDDVVEACREREMKVFFLCRDLRDCLVSYMRFLADTGRDNSHESQWIKEQGPRRLLCFLESYGWFIKSAEPLIPWRESSLSVTLRYEDIIGDFGLEAQRQALDCLCRQLGVSFPAQPYKLLQSLLNSPTLTWSGHRTNRSFYWSDEAEEQFVRLGGAALNASLSYC